MPAIIATDNFNRADSPTLGTNWTFPYSGSATMYRVSSNQCRCPTGGGVRGIFWNANSFANDQYAKVTMISFNSSFAAAFGVAVRCSGTAGGDDFNGYTFYSDGTNWKLSRQDAGVATNLATGTATFAVNDIVEIRAIGTTISGYQNGVAVSGASATDATYASGNAGMVVSQGGVVDAVCDDWEGGNVVVNVSVNLTGVAASPAIGTGTVTIGSVVVEPPPVGPGGGTGRTGMRLRPTEDKFVYLVGVAADPKVGQVMLLSEMQRAYEAYTAPIRRAQAQKPPEMPPGMRRLFKPVQKPVSPAVFVFVTPFPRLRSAVGDGKVTAYFEDIDEELMALVGVL